MVAALVNSSAVYGRERLHMTRHVIMLSAQHHHLGVQPDQCKPQRHGHDRKHDLEDRHAVRPRNAARSFASSHESGGTSPPVIAHKASV